MTSAPAENWKYFNRLLEVFLLGVGHSHFGDYSVYTRQNRRWIYLGSVRCGGGAPARLETKRNGWHGFSIEIEHERGRVTRTFYLGGRIVFVA
jgi:hypothetical protein